MKVGISLIFCIISLNLIAVGETSGGQFAPPKSSTDSLSKKQSMMLDSILVDGKIHRFGYLKESLPSLFNILDSTGVWLYRFYEDTILNKQVCSKLDVTDIATLINVNHDIGEALTRYAIGRYKLKLVQSHKNHLEKTSGISDSSETITEKLIYLECLAITESLGDLKGWVTGLDWASKETDNADYLRLCYGIRERIKDLIVILKEDYPCGPPFDEIIRKY